MLTEDGDLLWAFPLGRLQGRGCLQGRGRGGTGAQEGEDLGSSLDEGRVWGEEYVLDIADPFLPV